MMGFPKWLSLPAFVVLGLVTGLAMYPEAAKHGFSGEAITQLIVGSVIGGVVWGAVATWLMRRYLGNSKP